MHELSIAEGIVSIVHQHVAENQIPLVRSVVVKVGCYSGVVADSLTFSYEAITADTPLSGSFLTVEHIPFVISCGECGKEVINENGFTQCPACLSFDTKIVSGRELQVKEIELEDSPVEEA